MAQDTNVVEISENKPKERKITEKDWNQIAEQIVETWTDRKNSRNNLEKEWKEIDRQLRMEPDITHKLDASGRPDNRKAWMPEVELPLQAQTLEVLTADARRMQFPDSGPWFAPHAMLTDEYLAKVDLQSLVAGDENEVPSIINQDNADKLVMGVLDHWHHQYDFYGHVDKINAESFKYGMGIGRARMVTKKVFIQTAKGIVPEDQRIPVLFPRSIKNVYPDNNPHSLMNEGMIIGSSTVAEDTKRFEDIVISANKGSNDPNKDTGGWMPKNLKGLQGDKQGNVKLLEWEGDLVISKKTSGSLYVPNVIVTVCMGNDASGKSLQKVVRLRFRKDPFTSYIQFPYHVEHLDTPYPTSPLMKGWPIQKSAVEALSRMLMAAALNTQPPIGYNRDDMVFAQSGGPNIFPGCSWGTIDKIEVYDKIGNPAALFGIYTGLLMQYADVTGVNAPRLGAQTVSHTTAYAKDVENNRGQLRTVDYVRSTLKGPLAQWLNQAYIMGKREMKASTIYIAPYNGWVKIDKNHIPENVVFDVHGAGGPQEEAMKDQKRLASLQMALSMDGMAMQTGRPPSIKIQNAIEQVLRNGGWTDTDALIERGTNSSAPGPSVQPPMGNPAPGTQTSPSPAMEALAGLAGGG